MTPPRDYLDITIDPVLRFFDEPAVGSRGHATAIAATIGEDLGAGLLLDYFDRRGAVATVHPGAVTTGAKKGPRLDRWLEVQSSNDTVLYQVEIKSSSAHAIGGRPLRLDATATEVEKYKVERWRHHWDDIRRTFKWGPNRKVLTRMRPPPKLKDYALQPLICFWDCVHPDGKLEPFFAIQARSPDFDRASVFSMSAQLRGLRNQGHETVRLQMPDAAARLRWMKQMIPELGA